MQPRVSQIVLALILGAAGCSNKSVDLPKPSAHAPATTPNAPVDDAATAPPAADLKEPAEPAEPPAPPRAEALEIAFVGDVIFGRYRTAGYDPIPDKGHDVFTEVADALRADVLVGNLETPLVRELPASSPIGSKFRFGASLEQARHLVKAGFTAVSLANNHWYDMRADGVEQTPKLLEELGVIPLGAARAEPPLFRVEPVQAKGWRLGFIAATSRSNSPTDRETGPWVPFSSTRDMPGVLLPLLKEARENHDLLIVFLHWGEEYADEPAYIQRKVAQELIDGGADLVIGHHPHVLQGIERHGDGLIAYSLGNFLFENTHDPPRLTGVLRVRYNGDCLERVTFHPAYIKRLPVQHPVAAVGYMGRKVKERVRGLGRRYKEVWEDEGDDLVLAGVSCSASSS